MGKTIFLINIRKWKDYIIFLEMIRKGKDYIPWIY